jgi:hypothetical protein
MNTTTPSLVLSPVLSPEQIEHYFSQGYVLVSGLIPKTIAAKADAAAFRCNKYDPADPSTWRADSVDTEFFDDPNLLAMYTPELLVAASQLSCADPFQFPVSRPQETAFVIKLLPTAEPWKVVNIHLDGTGPTVYHETFSQPYKMFAMLYLHDIEPHAGGTVLFPRSHIKLMSLARSEPHRYRWLNQIGKAVSEGKVDLGPHFEVCPSAGDVLFMSAMMVHCKPMNTGKRPRFAMNMKW